MSGPEDKIKSAEWDRQREDSDLIRWCGEWVPVGEYEHGEGICDCLAGIPCAWWLAEEEAADAL